MRRIAITVPLAAALFSFSGCSKVPPALPIGAGSMLYFRIPWSDAFPSDVVVDEGGRVWFTDRLTHAIGVFNPAERRFERYPTPTEHSAPYGMAAGPDGALWFGESNGGRLGRIDPATGEITEVAAPGLGAGPQLVSWSDGVLWFTDRKDNVVGRYDPGAGEFRIWHDRIREPYGITAGPDGEVWVGSHGGTRLVRVDVFPDSGQAVDLSEPAPIRLSRDARARLTPEQIARFENRRRGLGFRRIAAGPDGRVWVTGHSRGRVVGVDPVSGETRLLATLDPRSQPYGIVVDRWGRVWYSEQGRDAIVVYDPRAGERSRLALPLPGGTVRDIAVDPERGRIWLPMSDIGVIAVVLMEGATPISADP